jgi:hypothetical protein
LFVANSVDPPMKLLFSFARQLGQCEALWSVNLVCHRTQTNFLNTVLLPSPSRVQNHKKSKSAFIRALPPLASHSIADSFSIRFQFNRLICLASSLQILRSKHHLPTKVVDK